MTEIVLLINVLCHIGYIIYVLCSIAEIKKTLRDIQKEQQGMKSRITGRVEDYDKARKDRVYSKIS